MATSPVVLFVGGPKHLKTEQMNKPPAYLQVPEKQEHYVGFKHSDVYDLNPQFKIITYRLEKYMPGPGVFIPMYVAHGMNQKEASGLVAAYFFDLFLENHVQSQNPQSLDFSKKAQQLQMMTEPSQAQLEFHSPPKTGKSVFQDMLEAMQLINTNPSLNHPVTTNLIKLIPELKNAKAICPECSRTGYVVALIQHLNDTHKWPIETKIADWLETLDTKFEVKK